MTPGVAVFLCSTVTGIFVSDWFFLALAMPFIGAVLEAWDLSATK